MLLLVDTNFLRNAYLSCTIEDGKVATVNIDNSGYGYKTSPTVVALDSNVVISTEINEFGQIVDVKIDNAGSGLYEAPVLEVRPYTVIVQVDNENNGKWSKFIYDISSQVWVRSHTQKYNTELYWEYQDWVSDSYNKFLDYVYTIDEVYELSSLNDLQEGDYVKIRNGGNGYYIIVSKTAAGVLGSFDNDFDLVYHENGTIRILDTLWNQKNSRLNFSIK